MNARRALLNLALALALLLVAWLIVEARKPPPTVAEQPVSEISRIQVDERFTLRREGARWWLAEPRRLPASPEQLQRLLDFLGTPVGETLRVAELELAPLGLEAPRLTLRLNGESLAFGTLDPMSKQRYLQRGDQVLRVLDPISSTLGGPWWNFVDRRLFAEGARVRSVAFSDGRRLGSEDAQGWEALRATIVSPEPAAPVAAPWVRIVTEQGERRLRLRRETPAGLWDVEQKMLYQLPRRWLDEWFGPEADDA
ncbi:DUF4340 domain-containing protein [Alkalilimnicola sp. S0819]|uniref:DUF4340 domain-containing protein n=1 Tax=Alkalilimnicola sp. S0819 TaxID=2613922 RepID=UPI0012617B0A|nr:DUF4340 domain-containing protein [Alkalilimnicola sp. S0819]KAB7627355.1 DUF4340 domain-containing protein [Alkalilimnicola sp. S0819]MPQ16073.1 DUF4340 domain-containing protein [Alkalilimnicola sp. S0819]